MTDQRLELTKIRIDGGTQVRLYTDENLIQEYAGLMNDGVIFPPITVFFDGKDYFMGDGFHRYYATERAGILTIRVDIKQGTAKDAFLFGIDANTKNARELTHQDKKAAVITILRDPDLKKKFPRNADIARFIGLSRERIGQIYNELKDAIDIKTLSSDLTDIIKVSPPPESISAWQYPPNNHLPHYKESDMIPCPLCGTGKTPPFYAIKTILKELFEKSRAI